MGNSVLDRLAAHAPIMKTVLLPRGRHRLHAMPTSTGYEIRTEATYDWDGRQRGHTPFTVLQHTIAGAGNLLYERDRYRLGPGDTMLLIVPHAHRYWLEEGGRWEFFWISMSGQEALRIHRMIQNAVGPVFRLPRATIERLADCSLRLIEGGGETAGAASAIAYEAAMILFDDVIRPQQPASPRDHEDPVRRTGDYIRSHLDQPLGVPFLADRTGLSRAHFTRQFRLREGQPPAEFVMHERMRRASRLLKDSGLSVKEVAAACGFADPNYFAKAFRRVFGISPTEFRTTGMYAAQRYPNSAQWG
jgi:AraC-like DNA-binding protein